MGHQGAGRLLFSDFEFHERLGKGASGSVYRVTRKADGAVFACKEMDLSGLETQEREDYLVQMDTEVKALSKMNSPFIIRYYGSMAEGNKLYIVTEFAEHGDVAGFLKNMAKAGTALPEPTIWRIFLQCAMGLHHMHVKRILHRDVKALNIFLDKDDNVKIGDLGISKIMGTHTNFSTTLVGTPYYLSPELCEGMPYDSKADMWALGIVVYELCTTGARPFDASNLGPLVKKIIEQSYTEVEGISTDLAQMIAMMLHKSMDRRASSSDILCHPIVERKAKELNIDLGVASLDLELAAYHSAVDRSLQEPDHDRLQMSVGGKTLRVEPAKNNGSGSPAAQRAVASEYKRYVAKADSRREEEEAEQAEAEEAARRAQATAGGGGADMGSTIRSGASVAGGVGGSGGGGSMGSTQGSSMGSTFSATGGLPPVAPPPPSGGGLREHAVYYAALAMQMDNAGDFENAFAYYQKALDILEVEIKKTEKGKVKDVLMKKFKHYLGRAEYIKEILNVRSMFRDNSIGGAGGDGAGLGLGRQAGEEATG